MPADAPLHQPSRLVPELLREVDFRRYWTGQTIASLGDQVSYLVIPLVAVVVTHADAAQMGYLTAAMWLPHLLFGLHAGVWADRRAHRRRVMIAADLGRCALMASIPLAFLVDGLTLTQLYVVAFAAGTLSVLFDVCNAPLFPTLVAPQRYIAANSLISGSRAMSQIAGPGIGGVLVHILSAPFALLADATSFAVSALTLSRIAPTEPPAQRPARGQLAEGCRFIARSPIMRASLAATATVNFFTFVVAAEFVLYATTVLNVESGMLGMVLSAGALGGVLGAFSAGPLARRIGVGPTLLIGCVAFPAPMLLIPAAHGTDAVALLTAAEFGPGVGVMWLDVAVASLCTAVTPNALRSRVSGAYRTVNFGARPLGSLAGGALASIIGLRPTLWAAVLGALTACLWLLPSPIPRLRALPTR
ncbi:putative MFS family arabinose efflux permease [Nocardia tenerifensis]|uniref:Putative MFS family arabinose efflux permease n=1 Tax=Nocardia tenerifensis TaxID=228006 RepID=A0A318K0E1_9NOCA|nr:MFS transporter [Nocardia tenerifensis]PXX61102.1 putative MFS family arabinose efflux permease [Nocardia tenerifensis]